jgi:hypothetical protein
MKWVVLAGILLAGSPAYANDKLPAHFLGRWCYSNASTPTYRAEPLLSGSQEVYFRPEGCCCSDLTDGITLDQEGYVSDAPVDVTTSCLFDNIKRKDRDTYLVHIHCKEGDKPGFEGNEEFQLINGLLFKKRAPEGAMTPAILWVLLVFEYLPTPHWGVGPNCFAPPLLIVGRKGQSGRSPTLLRRRQ